MKTYQKVLAIFSLLAFAESVLGQIEYGCFVPVTLIAEDCEQDAVPDEENSISYTLPNPLVDTTLTSFGQNPFFASQVASISSQIAQNIASAITQADDELANYESLGSIPIFGSIIQSLQGLSINISSQTSAIQGLLGNFNSVIGNEVDSAIVQSAINEYNGDVNGWQSQINTIQNLSDMNAILPTLISVETLIQQGYENFLSGSTFYQYPYYTTQLLYINAIMQVNVLNLLALSCKIASKLGQGDIENAKDSYEYSDMAQTMTTNYVNLLQEYANNAISYRMGFITSVQCNSNEEETTQINHYSFADNFTGQTIATLQVGYDTADNYPCFGYGVQMQAAQAAYSQAIQSATASVFDAFYSNFTSITSAFTDTESESLASMLFK